MKKWGKITLVIVGALIVTTLGIDAADTLSGKDGTLLSRVIETKGKCPAGMTEVSAVPGITCVDRYEVSAAPDCPVASPTSLIESQKNVNTKECVGESKQGVEPWSFVTREQALQMCGRRNTRLPNATEWYALTLGMADVESACNIASKSRSNTGTYGACQAPSGAYDLVGNLWEWVSDDVIDGTWSGRVLPVNGYVAQVDSAGVALMTETNEQELFGNDYFWSPGDGAFGMVRGGYYDSGTDGGMYAVHADTPTNAASPGIGFRCVL
jgi:hypothetical protein